MRVFRLIAIDFIGLGCMRQYRYNISKGLGLGGHVTVLLSKVNLIINPNDRHAPELRHFLYALGTCWSAHMPARTMPLRFEYKNVRRGADK
ncbi:MAG: hypothetical protein ACI9P7_001010 [Candidatus Azotimanducaceae bacterium]|jgi:hypothetical protein